MNRRWRQCRTAIAAIVLLALGVDARSQGYSPQEAAGKMRTPDDLTVKLVAGEPLVRQPVAIDFDERGRLWVIQYLQYPNPAGLARVQVDRFSRTVYDRLPEPPPRGPKGADRVTILQLDADGSARTSKDFLQGLNLASGLAFGYGGVFVLQTPYLLFYPDRNRDDVPDADPDVLLTGFGMEDAHSVANSLTWGPDGWLYGCQGSTVTARIRGIEFQQGVWRYHPITRAFELFCEGGGNSWGLDFDRHGNLLYSTNLGGHVLLHGVQGGYYWKSFGKHGALHNPHAYGYFDHVPHERFTGGHVTVGGSIYRGGSLPPRFTDKYIAGDLLGHTVQWHDISPAGTSFRTRHGGVLLQSNDTWFASSDVTTGPDGSVYVADWHDKRTAHPDPDAEWDRRNGRIYRIEAVGAKQPAPFDLSGLTSDKLLSLLSHRNAWHRRKAREVLADRRDPEVIFPLRTLIWESKSEDLQLEALWALYVSGGFNESTAAELLTHANPDVVRWTVRFLGDDRRVSAKLAERLQSLAENSLSPVVRSQLACSARRFPASIGLPIAYSIAIRDLDRADPHIPLLLWWAVEEHCVHSRALTFDLFNAEPSWHSALIRETILPRLMRRYAAENSPEGFGACAKLLQSAPPREQLRMIEAFDMGLPSTPNGAAIPPALLSLIVPAALKEEVIPLRVLARIGDNVALDRIVSLATDAQIPEKRRVALLQALADAGQAKIVKPVLKLLEVEHREAVLLAGLDALRRFDDPAIREALLTRRQAWPPRARSRATEMLLSRKAWAKELLLAVDTGKLPPQEIDVAQLRAVALHEDRALDDLVRKHWGNLKPGTPEEKLAEVRRFNNDLRAGPGDPKVGRMLFQKHCAACHRLFDDGKAVGPDLTTANRGDRDYLLVSIVDPGAVVRKEYTNYLLQTTDGRTLSGMIVERTPDVTTLVDGKGERVTVPRERIDTLAESTLSPMPEGLLKDLKPQELRDLFSYLQSRGPK